MITNIEKGQFAKLFNRGGYVLNFTTGDFDAFTLASVGVALCEHYGMSKGKSLNAFINEADDDQTFRLFRDLLEYYEENYRTEYEENPGDPYASYRFDRTYSDLYAKCKSILVREGHSASSVNQAASYLKERFTSEYLDQQIDLLSRMRTENPTEAIGKAKELIESCCKTILEEQGVEIETSWDISRLISETEKLLRISARDVDDSTRSGKIVKKLFGSLHGVAISVAEFRNAYGSGHGKSASFQPVPIRHAKLAVGSSLTLCEYLWETYEWRIANGLLARRR